MVVLVRTKVRFVIFFLLCIACFLLFFMRSSGVNPTVMQSETIDMGNWISGQLAVAEFDVKSSDLEVVEEVTRSCKCIRLRSGGDVPKPPFQIRGQHRLRIEIDTVGIVGPYHASVSLAGTSKGTKIVRKIDFDFETVVGWRVEPAVVAFENCVEGEVYQKSLKVFRNRLGSNLKIAEPFVSNPSRLIANFKDDKSFGPSENFEPFGVIEVRYAYETGGASEYVDMRCNDAGVQLRIPVLATVNSSELVLKPRKLFRKKTDPNDQIIWIEHDSNSPPTFLDEKSDSLSIRLESPRQIDSVRSVTKCIVSPSAIDDNHSRMATKGT